VFEKVGPPNDRSERFEVEFARRVRDAGHRVVSAQELFVHRFGDPPDDGPGDRADVAPVEAAETAEERTA